MLYSRMLRAQRRRRSQQEQRRNWHFLQVARQLQSLLRRQRMLAGKMPLSQKHHEAPQALQPCLVLPRVLLERQADKKVRA